MNKLFYILIILVLSVWLLFLYKKNKGMKSKTQKLGEGLLKYMKKREDKKSESKNRIIEMLKKNNKITNQEVQEILEISDATATRYLEELEKDGKIVQKGESNKVYYVLVKG